LQLIFHLPKGQIEKYQILKNAVTIGRSRECDVVVVYDGFSRKHALLEIINGDFFITDLNSKNGVLIDGKKITPGKKTLVQTFLRLQIGPAHIVEVTHDLTHDSDGVSPRREFSNIHSLDDFTRTVMRYSKKIKKNSLIVDKKPSKTKKKKKQKLPFFVLPLFIFSLGFYLYVSLNKNEDNSHVVIQKNNTTPEIKSTEFLPASRFHLPSQSLSCSGPLEDWCKASDILTVKSEGVVIVGTTLIVFMNLSSFLEENYAKEFNALLEPKRLEFFLMRKIILSNLLFNFKSQSSIDNLQIVGGVMSNGSLKARVAIKCKRDIDLNTFDKITMLALFDQILNQGEISKIPKISSLFDVLHLE
jgi:hypothetical protein